MKTVSPKQVARQAFDQIQSDKLLSTRARDVLRVLVSNGPSTSAEICMILNECGIVAPRVGVSPRLTELFDCGVVAPAGKRRCRITGRQSMTWEYTGKMPRPKTERKQRWFWIVGREAFTDRVTARLISNATGKEMIEVREIRRRKFA